MPHKKNVPPGNILSRYGTFLLFSNFIQISPHHSAALLPPALQGARQLFYGFSSSAAAELSAVRMAVLPFSQISRKKSLRKLLQLPVLQHDFFLNVFMVYHRAPVMHTEEYAPPTIPTISGAANSFN